MVVYQVTVYVPKDQSELWRTWMITHHIPDVMNTGCFVSSRIMEMTDNDENPTFVIEYNCSTKEQLEYYRRELSPKLQRHHTEKFGSSIKSERAVFTIHHEFTI